jgi:ribosomal-protein-alanine N-acetyltransferase
VIEIRPVGAMAAPVLAAIHGEAFDDPWSAKVIADLFDGTGVFAFTAAIDDEPAGFILCRVVADESEVLTLATRPADRRRGLASALLGEAEAAARVSGAATLFLEVATDNPGALSLYRAHGFRQVGSRPAYYFRPDGAVSGLIMRLDLNR